MKKLFKSLLCLVMLVSILAGCQNNKSLKVGIIQLVEHTSLNTIKESFDEQMIKLGYKDGENIEDSLPKETKKVTIQKIDENTRKIIL